MDEKTIILFLAANPKDTDQLELDREREKFITGLHDTGSLDKVEFKTVRSVRIDDLRQALIKEKPRIVHFSGHGAGQKGLVFEDQYGEIKLVSTESLADLFELSKPDVKCVVLNACYAEIQAEAIAQYIDYVIGMNDAISDKAAIKFSTAFYEGIGVGDSVEKAFKRGQNAIDLEGIPENLTPVLVTKNSFGSSDNQETTAIILEEPEGIVPLNSAFYVERANEKRGYDAILQPGELIRVKSPNKMGKTSYLVRLLDHAENQGDRTIILDLKRVNENILINIDKFLQWLCVMVSKKLGIQANIQADWDDFLGSNDNCSEYFEKCIFPEIKSPLVLALDNFERIFQHPDIEIDFCGLLRGWHEAAKTNNLWKNLKLVIVYSQENFIQRNINQSPFNVGVPIDLPEFTELQVKELIVRYGLNWQDRDVKKLMKMVGGHPYLIRLALYEIAKNYTSLEQLLKTAPTEAGIYSDLLLGHLEILQKDPKLLAAVQTIIASDQAVRLNTEEAFKLDSMGLIIRENNNVKIRCDLYRLYFCDRLEVS